MNIIIDIIEEIARIWGYEKISETFPRISNPASVDEEIRATISKEKELKALLVNSGFCEAKTYSMTGEKVLSANLAALEKHTLSLSGKPAGIYLIQGISGKTTGTARIIKR